MRVRLTGSCPEFLYFAVTSESSKKAEYDVLIDKETGWVECNCMDCQCRGRKDFFWNLLNGESIHFCKHIFILFSTIRRQLNKEQENLPLN